VDWKIELMGVPVSDVDRARDFYAEKIGFNVDFDHTSGEGARFVQLTPPGSGCSIALGEWLQDMQPGSLQGLVMVVPDLHAARAELIERGVEASDFQMFDFESGSFRPSREGEDLNMMGFFFFSDPDGNRWGVQQITRPD
jgi:catechol 2,3-dioxygenase-like lactoylglutathione lyase family enzyme